MSEFTEVDHISVSSSSLFSIVRNIAIFPVGEELLTELHLDIACNAGSKQLIGNPNSEATGCTGIYL